MRHNRPYIYIIEYNFNNKQCDIIQEQKFSHMSEKCLNCEMARHKLTLLVQQYEELVRTKEQEVICAHRIIAELQGELQSAKNMLSQNNILINQIERNKHKTVIEQQQTIQYLKNREVILLQQLKESEKEMFKLVINTEDIEEMNKQQIASARSQPTTFITPKKTFPITNSGNVTLNKQRQNNTFDRLFQQSTIRVNGSDSKDSLRLQVAQDKLNLMSIKYKMALLKTVEVATLR